MTILNPRKGKFYKSSLFYSTIVSIIIGSLTLIINVSTNSQSVVLPVILSLISFGLTFCITSLIKLIDITAPVTSTLENVILKFEKDIASFKIQTHVNDLTIYTSERKDQTVIYETLYSTLKRHFYKLDISDNGVFIIKEEEQAMEAYLTFWKKLLKEQKNRKAAKDENGIQIKTEDVIARITHSSSVRIWEEDKNPLAEDLLKTQQEFVAKGGKLIRFFITNNENSGEKKKERIDKIIEIHKKKYGLKSWHVPVQADVLSYDFLYLHKEGVILKWFTSPSGQKLAWMEIVDKIPDGDLTHATWAKIWYKCIEVHEERGEKIREALNKVIPEERQYHDDTL